MPRGIRSKNWNYGGNNWKLSRSKIDLYIECPRCFYLDNKLGIRRPSIPSFNINSAVDALLKKEFDYYRARQEPHPLFERFKIKAIPWQHPSLNTWRENFEGVIYKDPRTNLIVSGAIDDVWQLEDGSIAVIDYKSTAKESLDMTTKWIQNYFRQLEVYQWLLEKNNVDVSDRAYILYANGNASADNFSAQVQFEMSLHEHVGNTKWVEPLLQEIKECLDSSAIPDGNIECECCEYEMLKNTLDSSRKSAQIKSEDKPETKSTPNPIKSLFD
jgi:hypothetical protein